MLTVETYLAQSALHGLGVFTKHPIKQGALVSRFMPPFDVHYPPELMNWLTPAEQRYLKHYSYFSRFAHLWILPGDHDRFMNHSDAPNVGMHPSEATENVALRDIDAGEELTCDYESFDLEWREKLGRK
jgi:SET domain-containing protein